MTRPSRLAGIAMRLMAALVFLGPAGATAQTSMPQTMSYRGLLSDPSGQPLSGTFTMVFKLYNAVSGGALRYSETQSVTVTHGTFSVRLGSVTPLTADFSEPYYIEVTIGAETLAPRQPLASAAYALRTGCSPGDRLACYTGASGTAGVGLCVAGLRTCNAQGSGWSACVGEVTPNCAGQCVDLQADVAHCGTCGNACASGQTCTNGVCG
jgi:hypothetical protein